MVVSFLDYPYFPVGALHLKIAYLVFPFYLPFVLYMSRCSLDRRLLLYTAVFITCLIPSVLYSTALTISLSFLFGALVCVIVMWSFYELTKGLGHHTIDMMVWIYRCTIALTIPLVALGLQPLPHRGSFTLYEPSYWAIALIPYFCIVFHRLFAGRRKGAVLDSILILTAIVLSQSASMVLWCALSFLLLAIAMKRLRLKVVIAAVALGASALFGLYQLNDRAANFFDSVSAVSDWSHVLVAVAFIGGNRLQRTSEAFRAVLQHPMVGVGLGALVRYTTIHFNVNDFTVLGTSVADFDTSLPVTNMFLELWAESGILGLASFLLLIKYVFKMANIPALLALRVALCITLLSLVVESSYLRPYMWLLLGVILGYRKVCEQDLKRELRPLS